MTRFFRKSFLRFSAAAVLLLTGSGCGYRLQGSGSVLPPDVQKIAVAQVENNTTELLFRATMILSFLKSPLPIKTAIAMSAF